MTRTTTSTIPPTLPRRPQLIDLPALCEQLGVTERFVRRQVFERRIPYVKVGRLLRFDQDEINRWIDERRQLAS